MRMKIAIISWNLKLNMKSEYKNKKKQANRYIYMIISIF